MNDKKDSAIQNIIHKWNRISLRWKINFVGIFIIVMFSVILFYFILPLLEKGKMEEREGKLRAVVNSSVSLMDFYERGLRNQTYKGDPTMPKSIEEAKKLILKNLREMRYDRNEYFFVLDGNGNMIMHPTKPELEGKEMISIKDPKGGTPFRDMSYYSQRDGETFVKYIWQSKYSPVIFEPQTTYAKYYWPWDWVVCSGVYTQDIIEDMRKVTLSSLIYDGITATISMIFLFFVGGAISRREERHRTQLQESNNKLTQAHEALWGEMQLAKKIQTVLLPKSPQIRGYEISAHMVPADEVGGDYYDVINVGDRDWLIIGDVSGHGVPAGLVMMMVQTSIRVVLGENPGILPSDLLTAINKTISNNIKQLGENKYMTLTALAELKNGEFSFSGLHQDIMIYRVKTGKVDLIETRGIWIGVMDEIKGLLKDDKITMESGDVLLLYTDGLTEASLEGSVKVKQLDDKEMFGDEKLAEILGKHGKESTDNIKKSIISSLEEYKLNDDYTVLIMRKI